MIKEAYELGYQEALEKLANPVVKKAIKYTRKAYNFAIRNLSKAQPTEKMGALKYRFGKINTNIGAAGASVVKKEAPALPQYWNRAPTVGGKKVSPGQTFGEATAGAN